MGKSKKHTCFLFGAGEHYQLPDFQSADFIIAADGGFAYLGKHGVVPDLVIGDFDSLSAPPAGGPKTIVLPQEKDDTDMLAALREGWDCGFRRFCIYGGTGGRLDHTIANIQCLAGLACRGGRGYLFDRDTVITAVHNGGIAFPAGAGGIVSVFSCSGTSTGVSEQGLKYPLNNATLRSTYPLGVSNRFTGAPGSISVQSGTLLVIYPTNVQEVDP